MCRGRTTGFGTSTAYGANINCTCIMNPTNVTGYMTENIKKNKTHGTICISFFFFLLSASKPRERKKKGSVSLCQQVLITQDPVQTECESENQQILISRGSTSRSGGGECCSTGAGVELMEVVLGGFVGVDRLVQVLLAERDK